MLRDFPFNKLERRKTKNLLKAPNKIKKNFQYFWFKTLSHFKK